MNIDQKVLQDHIQSLLAVDPSVSVFVEIRGKDSSVINFNFGGSDEVVIFPIYSVAKTVLAVLVIDLVNKGVLSLDSEIGKYVKREIPEWLKKTTLRNLLAHRSGLFDYGSFKSYYETVRGNPSNADTREIFVQQVFDKGPQFEPDTSFGYSNIGYMLIKEIIESMNGKDLQTVFDGTIGGPLNIKMDLLHGTSNDIMSGFSPYLAKEAPNIKGYYDFSWVLHGTFRASLSDLTIFMQNLDILVGSKALKEMTNLYSLNFAHPMIHPSYGIGFMGDMNSSFGSVYGHTGGGPGFSVAAYVSPTKEVTVAAVVNRDSSVEAEKLVFEVLKKI